MADDFSLNFLFGLISKTPPHKVLGYLIWAKGMRLDQAKERFAAMSLREILVVLETEFAADAVLSKDPLVYARWFELLRDHMPRDLGTVIYNAELRERYRHLLERAVGKTRLQELLLPEQPAAAGARRLIPKTPPSVDPSAFLSHWAKELQTIILVAKTLAELPCAFDELLAQQKWAKGYVGARVEDDSEVQSVLNDAWRRIYQKLHTFDPSKGTFRSFALIWVTYAIRDYYRAFPAEPSPQSPAPPETPNGRGPRPAEERMFPMNNPTFISKL